MGAHFSISPGAVGGGAANASYITRSQAAGEGDELYHNAPDAVENANSWRETKVQFRTWADRVEAKEKGRHGNRAGQPRTHYRAIVSYEEEVSTEAIQADVAEFLEEEFPQAKAVAVVHQDTDNSHAHIWMSARKTDGKKIHIGNGDLKEMHATMDRIYEERMGVRSRNAEKVEETKAFKRRLSQLKEEGASKEELRQWAEANRPSRATPPGPEVYREREERLAEEPEPDRTEADTGDDVSEQSCRSGS
jgi:Relaxase/Mobilisation nuclease domain.